MITGPLQLPAKKEQGETPYFGMISIPPHDFPKCFSKFCFKTLQVRHEVIRAQQDIRKECNDVAIKDIYNSNVTKTMKVDEFEKIQSSSISQTSYYLKETWVNKMKEIIKNNFQENTDPSATGGSTFKSWFNLAETNRDAYEMGKLKRFLVQQKFLMQDTLLDMTIKSVKRFVDSIISFLPLDCKVIDTANVENTYYTPEQVKELGAPMPKFPLFQIDLNLNDENEPQLSHQPDDVVLTILTIFDNGLRALQEINQLEQKLMPHLFKSNQKMFLKVPVKPSEMPEKPDPNNYRLLPDENTWVYEEYVRLRSAIQASIDPIHKYFETFAQFKKEYELNVKDYVTKMDDPDNPPEPVDLRKDVLFHKAEEQRLLNEIPESIIVSYFKVNCRDLRQVLAEKHA